MAADPKLAQAWNNLGVLLKEQGQTQEAEAAYRQAAGCRSEICQAWYNLGVLLKQQGRTQEAVDAYRQAVAADPKYAGPGPTWGCCIGALNRHEEARDAMEKAVFFNPGGASDHAGLGAVYQKLGRLVDAEREFKEAQRLSENESTYNRACIAALCKDLNAAFALLAQAIAEHEVSLEWVRQDPDWEDLHEHPEFKRIIGCDNLPDPI